MPLYGKEVLVTYGGGGIKAIGLYDEAMSLLKQFEVFELPGIQPNPKYNSSVIDGVKKAKIMVLK
ncbi:MAG: hypothetical protein IJ060_10870 [Oscillospiraceae bacterium]|nr:hypothetical protein [Oscillospiraceae bacterium]